VNSEQRTETANADLSVMIPSVTEALLKARDTFHEPYQDALQRVNNTVADSVTTDALTTLRNAVDDAKKNLATDLPQEKIVKTIGEPYTFELANKYIDLIKVEAEKRITILNEAVVAWETELAAEKERIRVAEEARLAAEAAAQASDGEGGGYYSSEDPWTRINRIASTIPLSLPGIVISDSCAGIGGAIGCFRGGTIYVTSYGLTYSDCTLHHMLIHEYRHSVQWNEGLVQYDPSTGAVYNRDWLEQDAENFAYQYGC